jgi:hypothetical protein
LTEFSVGISEVYNFRGRKDTARQHLVGAGVAPFGGRAELGAAEEELKRRRQEAQHVEEARSL